MMDLALEFGVPYDHLRRTMGMDELLLWADYRNRREFPSRRIEVYLAQVCAWIARTAGHNVRIPDFFIDFDVKSMRADIDLDEIDVEQVKDAFGFAPTMRKAAKEK